MGKYDPLREFLAVQPGSEVALTFDYLEKLVGRLPHSAYIHPWWWRGDSMEHVVTWRSAGWLVRSVDHSSTIVVFARIDVFHAFLNSNHDVHGAREPESTRPNTKSELDLDKVRERRHSYLGDHYLGLHVTIVSIALATAGAAAASLIARPANPDGSFVELWLLWTGSLLATAVAYAGTMVGAFALPPSIPATVDLMLPLVMGVIEFLLFTILIDQITSPARLWSIVNAWLVLMAMFGIVAELSILQARRYFTVGLSRGVYAEDVSWIIEGYASGLLEDARGPILLTAAAALDVSLRLAGFGESWITYSLTACILTVLLVGLIRHSSTARMWRVNL